MPPDPTGLCQSGQRSCFALMCTDLLLYSNIHWPSVRVRPCWDLVGRKVWWYMVKGVGRRRR